jgi:threonine synthase
MKYYSTRNRHLRKSLEEAVTEGLAGDQGLFMPESIPQLQKSFFSDLRRLNFREISLYIAQKFFGNDIPDPDLEKITLDAINFDTPLVHLHDRIFTLELFHGPTFAFKDVGARFMARLLGYFIRNYPWEVNVLVATSGDTGSAVANGFWKVQGIKVHILYPKGLVSSVQEHQFTTLGENISALEIEGNFDDCQRLVKTAFLDTELKSRCTLTSANSINIARLIPQTFYYFNGYSQLPAPVRDLYIAVPSGNFGNLTAAMIAGKMGLPVKRFIAATNINDIIPEYLKTGNFNPRPSVATIANAMDVGNPGNFERILDLYGHSHSKINEAVAGYSYTDNQIRSVVSDVYQKFGYLLDPHGATGYQALADYMRDIGALRNREINSDAVNPHWEKSHRDSHEMTGSDSHDPASDEQGKSVSENAGFFIETAHPAKFADTVEGVIGKKIPLPEALREAMAKTPVKTTLSSDYKDLRDYLLTLN